MSCPCGSQRPESQCCGPYLAGAPAPTAEALMRSRYTAYVHNQVDYLLDTHDPATRDSLDREATARWARESTWLGLEVLEVVRGGPEDSDGEVEFTARWSQRGQENVHHERSRFSRQEGRWFYVDGATPRREPLRRAAAPGPNAPCPCGSGKKFKKCCGA